MSKHEVNPLISVCIPTYNNAQYIGKTLESIINQTYNNIEIVVSDNASTDDTERVVKSFRDKRIKYYKNKTNVGCYNNYNECLNKISASYVAFYHSDDVYKPDIVEKEFKMLMKNPDVGIVFTLDEVINGEGNDIKNAGVSLPAELEGKASYGFYELYSALLKAGGSFLICPTLMARKEVFGKVGLFQVTTDLAEDTKMWLRIAEKYKIGVLNERLIKRRISFVQGSYRYESSRVGRADHFVVLDGFMQSKALCGKQIEESVLEQYHFNKFWDDVIIAKNMIALGKNKEAKKLLLSNLSAEKYKIGVRHLKNIYKLLLYNLFLVTAYCNVAGYAINTFSFIKRKLDFSKSGRCIC